MGALSGVRVLDLTRLLPGPFATLVLADLGATVDKVEDPDAGDYLRFVPPQVGGVGAAFHALNRGKRSLVLDLKKEEGKETLLRLASHYDVLVEQFRPGVLSRLGVGHERLLERNPRLIVTALTGYGQNGPLRDRAGHDINYMARAGLLGLQGPEEGPPQLPAFQLADVSGGMWCVIAILAALREREETGAGKVIDVAMVDSVLPFATSALSPLFGGEMPARGGEVLTGGLASYNTYETRDGQSISLGALEPKFLKRFCDAAGIEFDGSAVLPGPHQRALKERFRVVFSSRTRDEWAAFGKEHDCCIEPVLRPDELLDDEHLRAREVFFEHDTSAGRVVEFRTPVTPEDVATRRAPGQGEHTSEILAEAGFSQAEIAKLKESSAVR